MAEYLDRDLQVHGPAQTERLKKLYEEYPGAVKAARVAKWMFRDMKGMDVEYIVNDVARDSHKTWQSRSQDVSGGLLFEAVVLHLAQYPDIARYSSLKELEKTAFTARGKETLVNQKWALKRSQVLAKVLLQECNCKCPDQQADFLLDATCRNASMIEYACLAGERPETTAHKLDLAFQKTCPFLRKKCASGYPSSLPKRSKTRVQCCSAEEQKRKTRLVWLI